MLRVSLLATSLLLFSGGILARTQVKLEGRSADLYRQAQSGRWFARAEELKPDIISTSDHRSFVAVWKASKSPTRWIASLHGTRGFATDDLALWAEQLKDRDAGIVCVQWWLGTGDQPSSYYTPVQIYHELDVALQRLSANRGSVMLHGFSRGSANSYAIVALDGSSGRRYFSLAVASSGGVAEDYPPTRAILNGDYGRRPLEGTSWITVAGQRDPNPDRDGIPGMRRTSDWLKAQGANVIQAIEDPKEGHGALQRNPENMNRVLDIFLKSRR